MPVINLPQDIAEKIDFLGLEPLKQFQFAVSIDGDLPGSKFILGFDRIYGLQETVTVRDVQEGGYPGLHYFPRRTRSRQLTLTRGMTFNRGFWDWFNEVRSWKKGKPSYARTLSISVLDYIANKATAGEPIQFEVWRFDILDAWPSEWNGPELDARNEGFAFESIVLQHGGISSATSLISGEVTDVISIFQQR